MGKAKTSGAAGAKDALIHRDPFVFRYLRFLCIDSKRTQEFYQSLGMSIEWQTKYVAERRPAFKVEKDRDNCKLETNKQDGRGGKVSHQNASQGQPPGKHTPASNDNASYAAKSGSVPPVTGNAASGTNTVGAGPNLPGQPGAVPTPNATTTTSGPASGKAGEESSSDLVARNVFAMSFRNPSDATSEQGLQLIFESTLDADGKEENPLESPKKEDDEHETARNDSIMKKEAELIEVTAQPKRVVRNEEYLVIYVHFLQRLVKRLQVKGIGIVIPTTEFHDMKVAVVKDPNNIEIRLVELSESQGDDPIVPPAGKKQWFAKIGYYTVPTAESDLTVRFYEKLFSFTPPSQPSQGRKNEPTKLKMGKVGIKKSQNDDSGNIMGFHNVDTEDFVIGLTRTRYFWMANESRSLVSSLCFVENNRADSQTQPLVDRSKSPLISIGFEVPIIDAVVKRWAVEKPDVQFEGTRLRIPGVGQLLSFRDRCNHVNLELFAPRPADANTAAEAQQKEAEAAAAAAAAAVAAAGARRAEEGMIEKEINFSHLRGQARVLSEGAINLKRPKQAHPMTAVETSKKARDGAAAHGLGRKTRKTSNGDSGKGGGDDIGSSGTVDGEPAAAKTKGPFKTIKVKMQKAQKSRLDVGDDVDERDDAGKDSQANLDGARSRTADRGKSGSTFF